MLKSSASSSFRFKMCIRERRCEAMENTDEAVLELGFNRLKVYKVFAFAFGIHRVRCCFIVFVIVNRQFCL